MIFFSSVVDRLSNLFPRVKLSWYFGSTLFNLSQGGATKRKQLRNYSPIGEICQENVLYSFKNIRKCISGAFKGSLDEKIFCWAFHDLPFMRTLEYDWSNAPVTLKFHEQMNINKLCSSWQLMLIETQKDLFFHSFHIIPFVCSFPILSMHQFIFKLYYFKFFFHS